MTRGDEPSLYLFDGSNILHAGGFRDRNELVDRLAGHVALHGARGVVVFDGHGEDRFVGPLEVRHAPHADALVERLAAAARASESVLLVTSDATLRATAGHDVRAWGAAAFLAELELGGHEEPSSRRVGDLVDETTRAALERLRRGRSPAD